MSWAPASDESLWGIQATDSGFLFGLKPIGADLPVAVARLSSRFRLMSKRAHPKGSFIYRHSLSIVSLALLVFWIIAYSYSDPTTRLGSFYGNAIADWSGSVVIILGTKFLFEIGSAESRPLRKHLANRWLDLLWRHSLLLFLILTGAGWL